MLVILRIVFGAALVHVVLLAHDNAERAPMTGDLANAGYLAVAVLLSIANAVVWAPFFGARLADPLTGAMVRGSAAEKPGPMLRALAWCDARRARTWVILLALMEGVHHPDRPAAFVVGLKNARRGSWLEKLFACEVWRFDNLQNCTYAFRVLRNHRLDPRPHANPEVNLALMAIERRPGAPLPPLVVPRSADWVALRRNTRIHLFAGADKSDAGMDRADSAAGRPEDFEV